jgi:hypothetical protein
MKRIRTSSLPLHASSGSDPYRPRKQIHGDFTRSGGGPAPTSTRAKGMARLFSNQSVAQDCAATIPPNTSPVPVREDKMPSPVRTRRKQE